ncbi:MAG TPA: SRPBCC domain-containing protein [Chitinophagaceae bacterium]|nr:SRPBCC domain-containing protein [Chitinophagaceae bacterium]
MTTTTQQKQTIITKDAANKKLFVVREFDGTPHQVWKAWTESNLLDKWWAPKPWKAKTKKMDFREGGFWLYCMEGPEGEQHWCREDFQSIIPNKSFTAISAFCDEEGNKTSELPGMQWKNEFSKTEIGTKVIVEITFSTEADLEKIIEMGFKEGFTMAHSNLDELLAQ